MPTISRQEHAALFGPTVGDKIRLGDTDLFVEIEKDLRHYGDESMYGGGKTLRGGMGGDARLNRDAGVLDLVITNVTVIDAVQAAGYGASVKGAQQSANPAAGADALADHETPKLRRRLFWSLGFLLIRPQGLFGDKIIDRV